jgi:hypothetical protein
VGHGLTCHAATGRAPGPALLSANTPQAIRDALVGSERSEFEQRYAEEMATAAHTFEPDRCTHRAGTYRKIAESPNAGGTAPTVVTFAAYPGRFSALLEHRTRSDRRSIRRKSGDYGRPGNS